MADDQFNAEGEACGMPVALQIDRLRHVLTEQFAGEVTIYSTDLYGLPDVERNLALDAVVAGTESPFVFVGGGLTCGGEIDPSAVLASLRALPVARS